MRKLLWIVVLVALAWAGWWWFASTSLRGGIATWLDARSDEGWQAETREITGGGFPFEIKAGLRDLALADPDAGLAVQTARIDIAAPIWWPGDVTVALDDTPITLASPMGRAMLNMQDSVMALNLHPGAALELETLGWTSGPWQLGGTDGQQVQADTLVLDMTQVEGVTYTIEARADAFAPEGTTRARLNLPDSFPRAFDSLILKATVTFDQPWDRRALSDARPQPSRINLHLAEARWGDLRINVASALDVDPNGIADGTLSLQAENWRTIIDLAERGGALPPELRMPAESVLKLLAGASGNPETLDVDLTLRDGGLYLGFLPLGPAPRFILR